MFILYDLIFLLISLLYLPFYFWKGKFHRDFPARLGRLPKDLQIDRPVWVHAVSVGEMMAVKGLLEELKKRFPEKKMVVSTVTATGNQVADDAAGKGDFVTYLPLDFSFIVKKVINRIRPAVFIIVETELWPNLIRRLYQNRIPIIVVNGRISDRSFKGYFLVKPLLRPLLNKITLFCAQTETDRQRLSLLGVTPEKIIVTGNMKFDLKYRQPLEQKHADFKLRLSKEGRLFVAASTHPGEEEIIFKIYRELLPEFGGLKLLVAPRHPERSAGVMALAKNLGFACLRISMLGKIPLSTQKQAGVFILDTIGELNDFYALAEVVFVGGSLVQKGGHNILEPASLSKPVLFGPQMYNFRDIAELFVGRGAALMVKDAHDLKQRLRQLLASRQEREALGKAARRLLEENRGATQKNAQIIADQMSEVSIQISEDR
ncbi:MAG: 3-deoxy-D-manno-octulosonic acid transferase [Candidatus Omnitrophica bacterium]|nr:3-deoxy-D-manno-octulosonic acid transferase [Candidatus Omnitrophota bacterium]